MRRSAHGDTVVESALVHPKCVLRESWSWRPGLEGLFVDQFSINDWSIMREAVRLIARHRKRFPDQ